MGRDHTTKQHARSGHREAPKSDNVYLKLLVKLYSFLARMYFIQIIPSLIQEDAQMRTLTRSSNFYYFGFAGYTTMVMSTMINQFDCVNIFDGL